MAGLLLMLFTKKIIYDHNTIMICDKKVNWGMKPFRMFECWRELEGYQKFMEKTWRSLDLQAWGGYILSEKFKSIKENLKEWRKKHITNLDDKLVGTKKIVNELERKGETTTL